MWAVFDFTIFEMCEEIERRWMRRIWPRICSLSKGTLYKQSILRSDNAHTCVSSTVNKHWSRYSTRSTSQSHNIFLSFPINKRFLDPLPPPLTWLTWGEKNTRIQVLRHLVVVSESMFCLHDLVDTTQKFMQS